MKFFIRLFALALGLSWTRSAEAQCGTTAATGGVTWTTQWCDEFNGAANSAIDSAKWAYDTGNLGVNNELEIYCDPSSNAAPCNSSSPNAYIDGNGHLAIQVRSPSANVWTSARLKTAGKHTFNSGRIEASLQIPSYSGLWPAFWLFGSQAGVPWPTVGESDIMENWPKTSNIPGPGATGNCSTIHTQVTAGTGKGQCFTLPSGQQIDTGFHAYGQIWSANMIQYYIDDPTQPYFVVTASDLSAGDTWPFSRAANPFSVIMNIAVGGVLGAPTDSATGSQPPMLVDYVRQYVPSSVVPQIAQPAAISLAAGASSGNTTVATVTQTQGTGRTAFSCTTSAPKASCGVTTGDAVNPFTADFSNTSSVTVTVTVTTTANTAAAAISSTNWAGIAGGIGIALLLLPRRRGGRLYLALLAALVVSISAWPACGGGTGGGRGGGGGSNGTTPGTYAVTVNAYSVSSSDAAIPSASTSFSLTVN